MGGAPYLRVPRDGINGFLGAFDRASGDPEFIQARHEEMAALMAVGHAKFTGEVGCCSATSGPGAIHLLNGLYDAKLDHQHLDRQCHQQFGAGINPQLVAWELSDRLPDGTILCADSGSGTNWWARHIKMRRGVQASLSGTLATMGPGTPNAWDRALAVGGPVVLEFKVDQEVPPIPPHIMKSQAKKAAKAWIKDPERAGLAIRGFRQKLAEFYDNLPGVGK